MRGSSLYTVGGAGVSSNLNEGEFFINSGMCQCNIVLNDGN